MASSSFRAPVDPGGQFHRKRRPPAIALFQQPPTERRRLRDHAVQLEEGGPAFLEPGHHGTERVVQRRPGRFVRGSLAERGGRLCRFAGGS